MPLMQDLKNYIDDRKGTYKKSLFNRVTSTIFAALGCGIYYSDKRAAWKTIKAIQKSPDVVIEIPVNQLAALNDGRLKEVIVRNQNELPHWFNVRFNAFRKQAAAMEAKKFALQQARMNYLMLR